VPSSSRFDDLLTRAAGDIGCLFKSLIKESMRFSRWIVPLPICLQSILIVCVREVIALQTTCASRFEASSLAVITAGVASSFTIIATDYPGPSCTIDSEIFGLELMPFTGRFALEGGLASQWSVSPPNQFVLPFAVTASGTYSTQIFRYGDPMGFCLIIIGADIFGPGVGLDAAYYENVLLRPPAAVRRVDSIIDFNWIEGPITPNASDFVSVRWTGKIRTSWSIVHTFFVQADQGARLWVGHDLLVDRWTAAPNM
jgi:hypothetical protein